MAKIVRYVAKYSPRQTQIVDDLQQQIITGTLPPGAEVPSVAALSTVYKSSPTTVQRAIAHLRESGYLATSQRGSCVVEHPPHLSNVGIVFAEEPPTSRYLTAWMNESARFAESTRDGGSLTRSVTSFIVGNSPGAYENYNELVAMIKSHRLSGLVFPFLAPAVVDMLRKDGALDDPLFPCVAVADPPPAGFTAVRFGSFANKALGYLAAQGRRRVAFVLPGFPGVQAQIDRYMKAAESHGMTSYPHWIHGIPLNSPRWAETCVRLLLNSNKGGRIDSLLISDDHLVPHATAGLAAEGASVPEDIEVVGHANFPYPTQSAMPVKRAGINIRDLFRLCVDVIERKRMGQEVPTSTDCHVYLE